MDFNSNFSRDQPGPSKERNRDRDDEMEAGPSTSRKRHGMTIDDSDNSDDGFETGDNGGQASTSQKRQRLNYDRPTRIDSDSDSVDSMNIALESIYGLTGHDQSQSRSNSPNDEPQNFDPTTINPVEYETGLWLHIMRTSNGWNKYQVLKFFSKHLGLRCYRNKYYTDLPENDFRIMVKFNNQDDRDYTIMYIMQKGFESFFIFDSIDETPIDTLEPEPELGDEDLNFDF